MHVILLRRTYERLCRIWKAIFHGISFEHIEPHLIRKYGLIMHTLEWNSASSSLGILSTIHQCIGITLWHKLLKLFLTFSHPFMAVQSKTPSQSINQWLACQFSRNGTRRNNFLANETVFMWLLPALRTWWPWLNYFPTCPSWPTQLAVGRLNEGLTRVYQAYDGWK